MDKVDDILSDYKKSLFVRKDIIPLDDIRKDMIKGFDEGYPCGSTTYFPLVDKHFTWLRGDVILFAGIGNHGKSAFVNQLTLIKSLREGVKWGVFSPEMNPPDYYYNSLIHTLTGKSPIKGHRNQMTKAEYERGMDFVKDHFFYVYPQDDVPTPEFINNIFLDLIKDKGIDGCITDPFNQLENDWEKSKRDDRYISSFLSAEKRFSLEYNIFKIIVAHPKSGLDRGGDGNYTCPTVFDIAGGAMWNNKCDDIVFVHRPKYHTNPESNDVLIKVAKIKKQSLVGIPGEEMLTFDRFTGRFLENGESPFDADLTIQTKFWNDTDPPF